jgi:hypothetical protein
MAVSLSGLSQFGVLTFAIVSALVYYMIRNVSTNQYIPLAIGIALMLFTTGTLQTIGLGVTGLAISRIIDKDIGILTSS